MTQRIANVPFRFIAALLLSDELLMVVGEFQVLPLNLHSFTVGSHSHNAYSWRPYRTVKMYFCRDYGHYPYEFYENRNILVA